MTLKWLARLSVGAFVVTLGAVAACGPTGRAEGDDGPADANDGGRDGGHAIDAGHAVHIDAAPPHADAGPFNLETQIINGSASSGTPDSYFYDVLPGDPFRASVVGGGNGTWSLNLSDGTSQGIYCTGSPQCMATVPAGVTTVVLTVLTDDIGSYSLTVTHAVH